MFSYVPTETYQNEIVNPKENITYEAKIGLMYVSDYEFAASPSAWTLVGYSTDTEMDYRNAINYNWMYMGLSEFVISSINTDGTETHFIRKEGFLYQTSVRSSSAIRPVFNLAMSVFYKSGSGSKIDPIRVV